MIAGLYFTEWIVLAAVAIGVCGVIVWIARQIIGLVRDLRGRA